MSDTQLNSDYRYLCPVNLPYAGRQKYMHSFNLANPTMPDGYEDYLGPVVALCLAARAIKGIAHMTVDEKIVRAGMSQRRPKPHVDGCFIAALGQWGHDNPPPAWLHTCNDIRTGAISRMPVIVAASISGCRAWRGVFNAQPKQDGDLSHVQLGAGEVLPAGSGYLLSPDCIHESMIFDKSTQRSFLRIALPVDYPYFERMMK